MNHITAFKSGRAEERIEVRNSSTDGPDCITFSECFRFPISTPQGRYDIFVGGSLLFTLLIGWILNLGHRLDVVYRLQQRQEPVFCGFAPWGRTFVRGLRAWGAIAYYLSPAALFGLLTWWQWKQPARTSLLIAAVFFFVLAIYVLPGGMTHNAAYNDMSYLYRPDKAMRRAIDGGSRYLKAWAIGLSAIVLSFLGLLVLGVGFFYTSVWAWLVVGYAFSRALLPELRTKNSE